MYYNFTNSNSKSELLDTAYMLVQQNPANLMIFASENKTVGPCKKRLKCKYIYILIPLIKYCLQYLYLYPKLGMLDSNQRIQGSKPWALPLGEYPKYRFNFLYKGYIVTYILYNKIQIKIYFIC